MRVMEINADFHYIFYTVIKKLYGVGGGRIHTVLLLTSRIVFTSYSLSNLKNILQESHNSDY